ncbi:spore coat protein U [Brenneria goodwinii]|uniref:Spore coat protein U n=1 Tax=Brenneria goodwinii TaxID=1109412 RepID=A0AAE8ET20_9GAMM|nr:spore coat U domain-containing protein [Brenneria goodwinii]MCG8157429.1 spore coat protein U domain-containing protein [Brenneria goodwinii]MCG8162002.1 spore coat protein U domain-containing protein [Brenneria goodwinii]MCG8165243.1 spore coat protein U domain-containing protein [Brenneria goodwinii]MCG8170940.1 spore coat protein U domain-containing protein [Brenneria goodwinii]MCG8176094.1 spore coat protein U domain-containing protein [Brenneria goodwinii]
MLKSSLLRIAVLILGLSVAPYGFSACTAPASSTVLGPYASSVVGVNGTSQIVTSGSGFSCSGSVLSLISTNTITATIVGDTNAAGNTMRLRRDSSSDYIAYTLCMDSGCASLYDIGSSNTWSQTTFLGLLGLFNASDGTLPIYIKTSVGNNVAAGTYTDVITIKWDYKVCSVGVLGLCVYSEGTLTSTLSLSLTITNDCLIASAPNINFGIAALPADFPPVSSSIGVNCTKDGAYTVKLTSSHPDDDNWRRMTASVNGTPYYLQYQIYRDNIAWTENADYADTGLGLVQSIPYTARINSAQANQPAGAYTDTVTVTVTIN